MQLNNISSYEQAHEILKAWWSRPKRIYDLKEKFPDQKFRVKHLWDIARQRKQDALLIEIYFKEGNTEAVSLKLNY